MSGMVHQMQGGRRAPKARSHYKGQLEDVANALCNWPHGFRAFLADTYDGVIEHSDELPGFRPLFNWLLVRLIKNDEEDGSAFAFLERELYRYGAQHWTQGAMAREGGSKALMPDRMRWGTMSEAAEATGLHKLTLKKRIAAGEIKSRLIQKRTNRGLVVDMDSIRAQQLTQYPAVSLRDAAPDVGVSIGTLRELRISGVMEENFRSAFPGCLTREDVDGFAKRVDDLRAGKRALQAPGILTLDEAFLAWTASPKEKAALIAKLLNESALVVGKKRGRGVGRLQVAEATATAHFETMRAGQPACLPLLETARKLGCTAAVVTWLKRAGHIKTRKHLGRGMPCLASVNVFNRDYEALARTAARVGTTAKAAYARLPFNEIRHVKVTTTQYSTVFVHRADLAKVERALRKLT
jgi:hypothetical protein